MTDTIQLSGEYTDSDRATATTLAEIDGHVDTLNRSTPPQLVYVAEPFALCAGPNEVAPEWVRLTVNGDGFGNWPIDTARAVIQAMAISAMVTASYVKGWTK